MTETDQDRRIVMEKKDRLKSNQRAILAQILNKQTQHPLSDVQEQLKNAEQVRQSLLSQIEQSQQLAPEQGMGKRHES